MLLEPVKAIDLLNDEDDDDNMSTCSSSNPGSFRRHRNSNRVRRSGKRSTDHHESSPLTASNDNQSPPPLPPRSNSFKPSNLVNNLTASFRRRNHTLSVDLPVSTASAVPETDELRKNPNEQLSLVQHAFQRVPTSQRVGTFVKSFVHFFQISFFFSDSFVMM